MQSRWIILRLYVAKKHRASNHQFTIVICLGLTPNINMITLAINWVKHREAVGCRSKSVDKMLNRSWTRFKALLLTDGGLA